MDGCPSFNLGLSGGWLWPSAFRPELEKPEAVCQRRAHLPAGGTGSRGSSLLLPFSSPPQPDLIEPWESLSGVRLYNAVEDGVAHYYSNEFGSAVPRELLRELLSEALDAEDLREALNLRGCRLCSSVLQEGYWLLAHPSGRGHELPTLTVMRTANEILNISCESVLQAPDHKHQILQLCFSSSSDQEEGRTLEGLPLLCARSQYWLKFYQVVARECLPRPQASDTSQPEVAGTSLKWSLAATGSLQSSQRICDMSWNPYLTSEVAFMCEDGSLRYVDASSSAPGSVNDLYPLVIKEGLTPKGATLRCCWSNHPRLLYYIVGMQLPPCSSSVTAGLELCLCDLRTGLAKSSHAVAYTSRKGVLTALEVFPGPSTLMALAAEGCVILLDARRPQTPLLTWLHGLPGLPPLQLSCHLQRPSKPANPEQDGSVDGQTIHDSQGTSFDGENPCLLVPVSGRSTMKLGAASQYMYSRRVLPFAKLDLQQTQSSQAFHGAQETPKKLEADLTGCIIATNWMTGHVVAFRFQQQLGRVAMKAFAPEASSKGAQEAEQNFGGICLEDSAAAAVYRVSEGLRRGSGCGFSWRPNFADRTYSQDLPQRLIGSLRDRRAQSERCRRFDSDSVLFPDMSTLPDILGQAFLPWQSRSAGDADFLLARVDYVGNLHIDPVSAFQKLALPATHLEAECKVLPLPPAQSCSYQEDEDRDLMDQGMLAAEEDERRWKKGVKHGSSLPRKPKGELHKFPKVVLEAIHHAKEAPTDGWQGEQRPNAQDTDTELLAEILEDMKVPMTLAEITREMKFLQLHDIEEEKPQEVALPHGVGTGMVPSGRAPEILSGRHRAHKPSALQLSTAAWYLNAWRPATLDPHGLQDAERLLRKQQGIEPDLMVCNAATHASLRDLPTRHGVEPFARETSTGIFGSQIASQAVEVPVLRPREAADEGLSHRERGCHMVVFRVQGGGRRGGLIPKLAMGPKRPTETQEARDALQRLEEAWEERMGAVFGTEEPVRDEEGLVQSPATQPDTQASIPRPAPKAVTQSALKKVPASQASVQKPAPPKKRLRFSQEGF